MYVSDVCVSRDFTRCNIIYVTETNQIRLLFIFFYITNWTTVFNVYYIKCDSYKKKKKKRLKFDYISLLILVIHLVYIHVYNILHYGYYYTVTSVDIVRIITYRVVIFVRLFISNVAIQCDTYSPVDDWIL